jgi:hypothetical protein
VPHYRGGVRADLPDPLHIATRMRSQRALTGSVLLAVLVVAAAGITGTTHFAGPRWLPHWKLSRQAQAPRRLPSVSSTLPPRTSVGNRTLTFPLGTVVLWVVVAIAVVGVAVLVWRWWAARLSRATTSRPGFAARRTSPRRGPSATGG